ncbi:MAG: hypothetical protein ACR2M0_02850 [Chloroflexia bacterium]
MNEEWDAFAASTRLELIDVDGVVFRQGDRVRLRPKQSRADAFDMLLTGKAATIESIEQDFENRVYLAVTVDDDPGRDFGMARKPGHRFFYSPEEVEKLGPEGAGA